MADTGNFNLLYEMENPKCRSVTYGLFANGRKYSSKGQPWINPNGRPRVVPTFSVPRPPPIFTANDKRLKIQKLAVKESFMYTENCESKIESF